MTVHDITKPGAPLVDPVKPGDKEITGTGEPGATVTITYPDGSTQDVLVDENGTWKATVPADITLVSGNTISVTQTDKSGNTSDKTIVKVSDNAPAAPVVNPIYEGDTTISGTGLPGATVTIIFPDGSRQQVLVGDDGKWQVTSRQTLKAGDVIQAFQADKEGVSSAAVTVKVQERKTAAMQANELPVLTASIEGSLTVSGTGRPLSIITVILPDGNQKTADVNLDGNWQIVCDKPLMAQEVIKASSWIEGGTRTPEVMSIVLPTFQGR